MLYQVHLTMSWIQTHNISGDTACIGSSKSNYHTITTTEAPPEFLIDTINTHFVKEHSCQVCFQMSSVIQKTYFRTSSHRGPMLNFILWRWLLFPKSFYTYTYAYQVIVHNIWKCFLLIGWLFNIFKQFMLNLGNGRLYICT